MTTTKPDTKKATAIDLEHALIDPEDSFRSPEDVLNDPRLPVPQKIEILCRWAYDCAELAVAEEEGMGGGKPSDMDAVLKALEQLSVLDTQHAAPTKHGGFCASPAYSPATGEESR